MSPADMKRIESALEGARAAGEPSAELLARLAERADEQGLAEVALATADSPYGELLLAATERGLVRVALPGADRDAVLTELALELSPRIVEHPPRLDAARRELEEYFAGTRRSFAVALDRRLSPEGFVGRAQRGIETVGFGEVMSYGELAERAGNPRASRAAGTACGRNPLPIVVPCHRIVRSGGGVGHYAGGAEMKRALLAHEAPAG